MWLSGVPYFLLITVIVLAGLYLANVAYDHGVPQYLSRKIGHLAGGMALFVCLVLFQEPWWPLILASGFTFLLGGTRIIRPGAFRGVGGTGRSNALAEVWFPLAATVSILVGWVWLDNPALGIVPALFMAWGDCVTGLIRSHFYGKEVKGIYGSFGMVAMCLLIAYFFEPYWIGVIGAVVATFVEKYSGLSKKWIDDNYTITLSSLAVMSLLVELL